MKLILSILLFISTLQAENLKVMVIDTGLDFNNKHLTKYVPQDLLNDSQYTYVTQDIVGHGTHITGIITKNICPEVDIIPCRFYTGIEYQHLKNTIRCINWAMKLNINIINFAAGGIDPSPSEKKAIINYLLIGNIFVTAAGNFGSDLKIYQYYPASYNIDGIVAVGSIDNKGRKSDFSNWGIPMVWERGEKVRSWLLKGKKGYMTGTSQATAAYTNRLIRQWCKTP